MSTPRKSLFDMNRLGNTRIGKNILERNLDMHKYVYFFSIVLLQAVLYIHFLCLSLVLIDLKANNRYTIMYLIWLTIASLTYTNCFAIDGTLVNVNKYCRDKDRLITSEEKDEYLLVSAENHTTIILACRYW